MFEQSLILDTGASHKVSTVLASLTGQIVVITAVVMAPLLYTHQLPKVTFPVCVYLKLPTPPPPLLHLRNMARPVNGMQSPQEAARLSAPVRIPIRIANIIEDTPPASNSITALGQSDITGALPFGVTGVVPAPPPQPPALKPKVEIPSRVRVSEGVLAARIVNKVVPSYPQLAKQARISGVVKLEGIIARDGTIQNLRVISGHPLLVNAALDSVRQWLYKPTLLNGVTVEVVAPIEVFLLCNSNVELH